MKYLFSALLLLTLALHVRATEDIPKGFHLGSIHLGYMSQDEYLERISVEEISGYINRLKKACTEIYANKTNPQQFYIVLVVHSGHSHCWLVDPAGVELSATDDARERLEKVPLPVLKKAPVAFALDARIAGGRVKGDEGNGAPPVPDTWKKALAGSKSDGPLHFDDVIRLVCSK